MRTRRLDTKWDSTLKTREDAWELPLSAAKELQKNTNIYLFAD